MIAAQFFHCGRTSFPQTSEPRLESVSDVRFLYCAFLVSNSDSQQKGHIIIAVGAVCVQRRAKKNGSHEKSADVSASLLTFRARELQILSFCIRHKSENDIYAFLRKKLYPTDVLLCNNCSVTINNQVVISKSCYLAP